MDQIPDTDFDLSNTYEQAIAPRLEELADECQKRGIPFAFYVVPKIEAGVNDAREFAWGEGDFLRSLTYLARNWQAAMTIIQSASNFSQHIFASLKMIAANQLAAENDHVDDDGTTQH